jgi:polyketide biosynthesis 3-hydroxy-3-methylglutaryl-CoA synthase-like enzyme PksG
MTSVGIEALNVYGGAAYVDVEELCSHRGLDIQRFENLMMREKTVRPSRPVPRGACRSR